MNLKQFDLYGWNYAARPERAEALSPGQRPGYKGSQQVALCKGKSFEFCLEF